MYLEELVAMANANEALMDGTTGPVALILEVADVVFGVFNDPNAGDGVGSLIIKGASLIEDIAAGGRPTPMRITAVKTVDREMAIAARFTLGDGRDGRNLSEALKSIGDMLGGGGSVGEKSE